MGSLATKAHEWSKITSDPWILQFKGYRLEFVSRPWQFAPPKRYPLSDFDTALIAAQVDKLLSKGAIIKTNHVKGELSLRCFWFLKKQGI